MKLASAGTPGTRLLRTAIRHGQGLSAALAVTTCLGLSACDAGPSVTLVNGVDRAVVLHLKPRGRFHRADIELKPGEAETFNGEDTQGGPYSVSVGPCELTYLFPEMGGVNYQGEQLGPLYLPSNLLGGLNAMAHGEEWHGPHNWNERGPQNPIPTPWAPRP